MKIQKYIFGATALLMAGALASCTEGNDWESDSSFSRLFGVSDLAVTEGALTADVSFTGVSGAEYYTIQLDADSTALYDGNASISINSDGTSCTVSGLTASTPYYMRVQACSTKKNPSKWVYFQKTSSGSLVNYFKTNAEAILEADAALATSSSARVTWDAAGFAVTHLVVSAGDMEPDTIYLDAAAIEAQAYTLTGLEESTVYTVKIYNGDVCRGTVSVTTAAGILSVYAKDSITIVAKWTAGATVSHVVVTDSLDNSTSYPVPSGQDSLIIKPVNPRSAYVVALYNDTERLGKQSLVTPAGDGSSTPGDDPGEDNPSGDDPTGVSLTGDVITFTVGSVSQETYTVGDLSFVVDATSAITIEANSQYFGNADHYINYTTRFKSGKTSSSRKLSVVVTKPGTLYIAARSGSSSETRNLSIESLSVDLSDSNAIDATVKTADGSTAVKKVFPIYSVELEAGTHSLALGASINIYGLKFVAK